MEESKNAPETLYLFECSSKHRVSRLSKEGNSAYCSRCNTPFGLVVAVPREENETEVTHRIRTMRWKKR